VTAGLVLAAGGGTRFGGAVKQLAELEGRPLLEHALRAQTAVLERVVVVLGAHADAILAAVDLHGAQPVVCERWPQGQAASLQTGLAALRDEERVLVTLGDQPLVGAEVVARMAGEPPGSRAAYDGAPGHPAVLGPEQLGAAAGALRGDRGLRDLHWRLVECGALGDGRDVDTPDDLEVVRAQARAVLRRRRAA
jgi:CTP:molybdopterin cytidylyltransferase MocA